MTHHVYYTNKARLVRVCPQAQSLWQLNAHRYTGGISLDGVALVPEGTVHGGTGP